MGGSPISWTGEELIKCLTWPLSVQMGGNALATPGDFWTFVVFRWSTRGLQPLEHRSFEEKITSASLLNSSAYAASIATTLPSRIALMSRIGGWPKNRLYSRLNWLTLS